MGQVANLFGMDTSKFNLGRGVAITVILVLPLIVLTALDQQPYWLSVSFGALFVALSDPGGRFPDRVRRMALVGTVGALLTGWGVALNGAPVRATLAAFSVTLVAGLSVQYGQPATVAATMLNLWFVLAIALPVGLDLGDLRTHAWGQVLAWLAGSVLAIASTGIARLCRGPTRPPRAGRRHSTTGTANGNAEPQHSAAGPQQHGGSEPTNGDAGRQCRDAGPAPRTGTASTSAPTPITRQVVGYAVIRAVAVSIAVGITFGLRVPHGYWMPIATIAALKPSLHQTTLVAAQRVAGTVVGAAFAAALLLTVHSRPALSVIIIILGALAGAIRTVSYTWFAAATAGAVLLATGLPHPSDLSDEGRRIAFTFIGVAIAVCVTLLGNLLGRQSSGRKAGTRGS